MSGPEEQKLQEAVWKTRKNQTSRTTRRVEAAGFHPPPSFISFEARYGGYASFLYAESGVAY